MDPIELEQTRKGRKLLVADTETQSSTRLDSIDYVVPNCVLSTIITTHHCSSSIQQLSLHFNTHCFRLTWVNRYHNVSVLNFIGAKDDGGSRDQGSYSLKHIVRTIEQRSYDLHRRYDTTYSQNVSQTVIVSYVRYDVGASSLTNVLHFDRKNATRCTKTRYLDKKNPNNNNYYYYELAG